MVVVVPVLGQLLLAGGVLVVGVGDGGQAGQVQGGQGGREDEGAGALDMGASDGSTDASRAPG
jgi:hypothetical protein